MIPSAVVAGTSLALSRVVLGTAQHTDEASSAPILERYRELGGSTFDTAWFYGDDGCVEKTLGGWIARNGRREDVRVIDKVGRQLEHCHPAAIRRQLAESLDRLGTGYVDLLFVHRDNPEVPVGAFVDALNDLVDRGLAREVGASNWPASRYEEANAYASTHGLRGFAALSNHLSLARAKGLPRSWAGARHISDDASRDWLRRTQTTLVPWSSQARGFFARPDASGLEDELRILYYSCDNLERLRRARSVAARLGLTPTSVALMFVLEQPFPTFPVIGPATARELDDSARAFSGSLGPDLRQWLDLQAGAPDEVSS